jgi:hypothetical protein
LTKKDRKRFPSGEKDRFYLFKNRIQGDILPGLYYTIGDAGAGPAVAGERKIRL